MQTYFWKLQNNQQDAEVMQKAAALIQAGEVVAFPTRRSSDLLLHQQYAKSKGYR